MERLSGPPVDTLVKWGNGGLGWGRNFDTTSGNGTRLSAVSSSCRSSEACVASVEYSSPVFSLKTKEEPLGKGTR